jgi:hypothetical protein
MPDVSAVVHSHRRDKYHNSQDGGTSHETQGTR